MNRLAKTALLIALAGGWAYGAFANAEGLPSKTTRQTTQQMEVFSKEREEKNNDQPGGSHCEKEKRSTAGKRTDNHTKRSTAISKKSNEVPEFIRDRETAESNAAAGKQRAARAAAESAKAESNRVRGSSGVAHTTAVSVSFLITAYTAGYESTQKHKGEPGYGLTATGTTVAEGRTIAADWAVLPPGTVVEIEGLPGRYTVEDKGGAVNGNHIDLYLEDLDRAKAWGKQQRKVTIIERGEQK